MTWAQIANTAASALVTCSSVAFCAAYAVLAPWRRSEIGRHVMAVTAAIGGLGAYTVAITAWPDGPPAVGLRVTRMLLLVALAGLLVQRTRILLRAQRKGRRRRSTPRRTDHQ